MKAFLVRGAAAACLMGSIALLAGCGSGDSSSAPDASTAASPSQTTTAEPEATQADFVAKADQVCKASEADLSKLLAESNAAQEEATSPETLASPTLVKKASDKVGEITDQLAETKDEVTDQLAKVDTPDQKALDKWIAARRQAADDLRELADAWRAFGKAPSQATSDAITAAQEKQLKSSQADLAIAGEDLHLKVCSKRVQPA